MLFADLVGFTTFSEGRDPEDVRNMLTHFYEKCREIIGRYGGTTDKFIGDAVMGVWGAVEAHEDDAERATRAGLELVDMVKGLGGELGIPDLAARAGILSGSASVGSGGNEQGLVVGDLVNTASRLQSIASPGSVYVGSTTRDLVGSAIEFREVGEHQVKGKEVAVTAFEAVRVLALSSARTGSDLLEGPFVGRDDELRLLKDQLHATGREGRARMVSIIGEGGIGKSRLAAELIRYIDGITEDIYYHGGRSPSYGDGVTFWALGEMIRQRAGITEGEEPSKARMKLRTVVADFFPSQDDQRWIEPRLAAVLGLASGPPGERAEHFAALRAFFQGIAARGTVSMVFEDLQWADEGLLDFIEELVERTTSHPILVLCLARPELLERRSDWAASRKRTLTMHLSRLNGESMTDLVAGLAPGLPESMVERIVGRSAGVPLHAVEFVRMLLNTGQLVRDGDRFEFTGSDEQMPIPDSVSAMIGARIDRLEPDAQSIIRDASVLGLTFTVTALSEMRGDSIEGVESVLSELIRREVLELDENPRSPERGQYRFVQGLIREVAYSRLSRQERVSRHLAAAHMFQSADDPELAGVVASHYADAVEADPGNQELVQRACRAVIDAAERAAGLKSDAQAAKLYERAADMTTDAAERASLRLEAARCLARTGREDRGISIAREVLDLARENGDTTSEIRAVAALAHILSANFETGEAAELTREVYEKVFPSADPDWIDLAQETSRALFLSRRTEEAIAVADAAIPIMEDMEAVEAMLETLINKAGALMFEGGTMEGTAVLLGVAEMAGDRDLLRIRLRAINNLVAATQFDKVSDLDASRELDALTQRVGDEAWVVRGHFFAALNLIDNGHLDEALDRVSAAEELDLSEFWADNIEVARLRAELYRSGFDEARFRRLSELQEKYVASDDAQLRIGVSNARAAILLDTGRLREALELGSEIEDLPSNYPAGAQAAVFAAAQMRDMSSLEQLRATIDKRYPRGRASRGLTRVAESYLWALRGDVDAAERAFIDAEELWSKAQATLVLAYARAVFALLVGTDHELAAVKAEQARRFFAGNGYKLFLDGIMAELPDTSQRFDVDPLDRGAISGR
ncbi:MAG TPA: adenylate/guanylate cyclase domain-containing protein [Acidimicrobiia bacterium]